MPVAMLEGEEDRVHADACVGFVDAEADSRDCLGGLEEGEAVVDGERGHFDCTIQ